jgi:branched-subunit amino acid transport protein AzlD
MDNQYVLMIFAVMAFATFVTRALPFIAFSRSHDHPMLGYFGHYLPPMIMVVLVCFGLTGLQIETGGRLANATLAFAAVTIVQLVGRNTLVSILVGTGLYVFGIQGLDL